MLMKNSALIFASVLILSITASAQTLPSVSVVASDPVATEPGPVPINFLDTGAFTITRQGPTNLPLMVFLALSGTASNGVDYVETPTTVTIREGERSARVSIVPLADDLPEGDERVLMRIAPSPLAGPGSGYILPTNSLGAIVTIRDVVTPTNSPPRTVVSITATDPEGSEIPEVPPGMERPQLIDPIAFTVTRTGILTNPLTVRYVIAGTASNGVDYVEIPRQLEIAAGASSAEIEVNVIDDLLVEGVETISIQLLSPVCAAIAPPPPECYLLGTPAVAFGRIRDNDFPETNKPPVISIAVPTNGAVFFAPADISIIAQAFDTDGYVQTVQFFAGTNSLGITTNNPFAANIMNPFQMKWEDVAPGQYVITALATDNDGAQSRSGPVRISVLQEPVRQTVVNIRTIDPEAAEQDPRLDRLSNNALLRVTRSGSTDSDLPVRYRVDGTAINGVDYVELGGEVIIPKGAEWTDIVIEAIDDKLVEPTESILVTIVPPVCIAIYPPPPECYLVGSASRANAFILDDEPFETNSPPRVEITQPIAGTGFRAPAEVHIVAKTVDRDGYVGTVEFFANNHKIGEASKQFLIAPPDGTTIEYELDWQGVAPGQYALTARAIDDGGTSGLSAPVRISVVGTNQPPPTNMPVVTVYAIDGQASEGPIIRTTNALGTNVAVFEIRRSGGGTNTPLRVLYEMHGTASEGVDYLDLPNIVEIPAGQRSTRVVIVPIDDELPEKLESVVICLRPSPLASILETYLVGAPGQAAAVIADNDVPRLPYACLGDGLISWSTPAPDGECFRIECSNDLQRWAELCTLRATGGSLDYTDAEAMAYDRRFYRAVPVSCPVQ